MSKTSGEIFEALKDLKWGDLLVTNWGNIWHVGPRTYDGLRIARGRDTYAVDKDDGMLFEEYPIEWQRMQVASIAQRQSYPLLNSAWDEIKYPEKEESKLEHGDNLLLEKVKEQLERCEGILKAIEERIK